VAVSATSSLYFKDDRHMDNKNNNNLKINYQELSIDAMRNLVHKVLKLISETGLPEEHHFYITFATNAENVHIPKELKKKYPNEMTIVIQHSFWELIVNDNNFTIILSFNNKRSKLEITFNSILSFSDPYANFMLNFPKKINKKQQLVKTKNKKSSKVINIKNFKKDH